MQFTRPSHLGLLVLMLLGIAWWALIQDQPTVPRADLPQTRSEIRAGLRPLVRAENSTLLLGPAVELPRQTKANSHFEGPLFEPVQRDFPGPLSLNEHTKSVLEVDCQPEWIEDLLASDAETFSVPLAKGHKIGVKILKVHARMEGSYSVLGKVVGQPLSDVILVFHDGAVAGSVAFYEKNEHYEFGLSGDGKIAVRELDVSSYDQGCACEHDPLPAEPQTQIAQDLAGLPGNQGEMTLIDTVVGYGSEARIADGGVNGIEARIIASVERSNLAFENSEVGVIRLVLLGTIEDPDYQFPMVGDMNNGQSDELNALRDENDGFLDAVTDLRTALDADHVTFVTRSADGSAGIAFRPGRHMIAARTYMTSTRITFVHELGHNIGCRHSWGDTSVGTTTSNHGWRFAPPGNGRYRTVMAYNRNPGWSRIPYFSNPSVLFNGEPTGRPDGFDVRGVATVDQSYAQATLEDESVVAGFDGSNPNLGARNSDTIIARASILADRVSRDLPGIQVLASDGSQLVNADDFALIVNQEVFTLQSSGDLPLENIAVSLSGPDVDDFQVSAPASSNLPSGQSTAITVSMTGSGNSAKCAVLNIQSNDPRNPTFAVHLIAGTFQELDQLGFENSEDAWANTSTDLNWISRNGGTPSDNTGPSGAFAGSRYYYIEATDNSEKTAQMEDEFDFSGMSHVYLDFAYHMAGARIESLSVDVFDSTWNLDVWKRSDAQQASPNSPWKRAGIDLSSYAGQSGIRLRLRGVTGTNFQSDIAVDDLTLRGISAASSDFLLWAAANGLDSTNSAPLDIIPGTELENLLKYAFNLPASAVGRPVLPESNGEAGLPRGSTANNADAKLRIEYLRRKGVTDLEYLPQFSGSLSGLVWEDGGTEISVTSIDDVWERVIVEDPSENTDTTGRFCRLKVQIVAP